MLCVSLAHLAESVVSHCLTNWLVRERVTSVGVVTHGLSAQWPEWDPARKVLEWPWDCLLLQDYTDDIELMKLFVVVFVSADEVANMKRRLDSCYKGTNQHADDNQQDVDPADSRINQVHLLHTQ